MRTAAVWLIVVVVGASAPAYGADPPSKPGIDAPELAHLGPFAVGVRTFDLVQPDQVDGLAVDPKSGTAPRRDRRLTVDLWYPARVPPGAVPETYTATWGAETAAMGVRVFSAPGIAVRDAKPQGGRYPFVVVSHGHRDASVSLSWLTENLASKGYVVAAIRHNDPAHPDPAQRFFQVSVRRPLDIVFVTTALQSSLGAEGLVDPTRTALVGYSVGGYGVLTVAGAALDPEIAKGAPDGLLFPYTRGGAQSGTGRVNGLKAVVTLAPWGNGRPRMWGADGLAMIAVPLLVIAGDRDHTIGLTTGRTTFEAASGAHRYLLTYKNGGHYIGLDPPSDGVRPWLWNLDYFVDPVWRTERVLAINQHMITAFLDLYLKGDKSRAAYLDVPVEDSAAGVWPDPGPAQFDDYSPGNGGVTVWKGFQKDHAEGLELIQRAPEVAAH
jgi:predicted dienelactone hydrolase